jgi:hypothetical protein
MRFTQNLALAAVLGVLTGCHSAYIEATVSNRTAEPLSLVEVDYPSASFGTQTLAPGEDFHYRFKVLGSGGTTVMWTDAERRDHKSSGPALHENNEGRLTITFTENGPVWNEDISAR